MHKSNAFSITAVFIGLLFLIPVSPVRSGGVSDLEEGLPTRMEDAYPIGYLGRELQMLVNYERDHEGVDAFRTELRLEVGFPRNGQIRIAVPYRFGEVEPDGIGDIRGELFYNINQETLWLPAAAIAIGARAPTSDEGHGVDPIARAVFTKTISGRTNAFQQLHLNVMRRWNDEVEPIERSAETEIVFGYSRLLRSNLLVIFDVVRHWRLEEDMEENIGEIGIRYQITPLATLSFGTGFGFGDDSPDVLTTLGFQILF